VNVLLPATIAELQRLGLRPAEAVFDAGFRIRATRDALAGLGTEVVIVLDRHHRSPARRA